MRALRKFKIFVFIFVLVALLSGGLTIMSTEEVMARPACCIWVMYCTQSPPIVCWDVCIPVPCP